MRRAVLAVALLAGVTATAAAKPKPSKHAKHHAASGVANNMPAGFVWPPSQTMTDAGKTCEQGLDDAAVKWEPATREGHIVDAVTITDGRLGGIDYVSAWGDTKPYKMDCQLALALELIGPELHALGVREVRFGSIYRWSNVRVGGKTKHVLSRHALGLAMDVVSFVEVGGREANVAKDYKRGDALLHDIEHTVNASKLFRIVLTPQNDPISHHDHFHIEANPSYSVPTS